MNFHNFVCGQPNVKLCPVFYWNLVDKNPERCAKQL